jgi:hypothetical protein
MIQTSYKLLILALLIPFLVGCGSAQKASIGEPEGPKPEWFNISASTHLGSVGNFFAGNGFVGPNTTKVRVLAQKSDEDDTYKVLQVQVPGGISWQRFYFKKVSEDSNVYKFDFGGQAYYFQLMSLRY